MSGARDNMAWRTRALVVFGVFVVLAAGLMLRAVQIQLFDGEFLTAQGDARHLRMVEVPAHRGMILDRHGEPLAASAPVDSIWAVPGDVLESARAAELADALDLPLSRLEDLLAGRAGRQFVWIRRHLSPEEAQRVMELRIPGVHAVREYRRFYPSGEVTGHLLGFTNIDDVGQEGIELAFNEWLRGEPGRKQVLRDRMGRPIADVQSLRQPRPGRDLRLTIDRRVQYLAYRELRAAVAEHGARGGTLVILDARTGEVLAMVNQPAFNPNNRADRQPERYRNRALTDVLEPGSSFKPFVIAAALASGKLHRDSVVDTGRGLLRVRGGQVSDPQPLGEIGLDTLLGRSSNVGASKIALGLDPEYLWHFLQGFGFGSPTASGFPGEQSGQLNHYMHWREIGQATLSYGYGLSVTPMQLAQAYAVIAADGMRHPVSLVQREHPVMPERVMDAAVARDLRHLMESGLRAGGQVPVAQVRGYRVAGKTGTVRKSEAGGYSLDRHYAVFAGMAPASSPRVVAVVVVDEPARGRYYGSQVAAPVFSRVMAGTLRLLDIPPDDLPGRSTVLVAGPRP